MSNEHSHQQIRNDLAELISDPAFAPVYGAVEQLQQAFDAHRYPAEVVAGFIDLFKRMRNDINAGKSLATLVDLTLSGGYIQPNWLVRDVYQAQGPIFNFILHSVQEQLVQPDLSIKYMPFEPEVVLIPGGPFLMGSPFGPDIPENESPQHPVVLPSYRIGVQPVTNREYAEFIRQTRRIIPIEALWNGQTPPSERLDEPVKGVNFFEATAYCAWLSGETGRTYRLPNEAEWEKAATLLEMPSMSWGEVPEWSSTLWGEKRRAPDAAYTYPWREDSRNNITAGTHLRRVLRGAVHMHNTRRPTARSSAAPDERGPPRSRYGFRIILERAV